MRVQGSDICVCVCVGGVHNAQFNSSIQAFTFQMLIAMSSPSPPFLLKAQPPTPHPPPIPPRLHWKNGPLTPNLSLPYSISTPTPPVGDAPLTLGLGTTSNAPAFKVFVKRGDTGDIRVGGSGCMEGVDTPQRCARKESPHTMDEDCSR